jgi:methionyl-tRNA formyltransferase
MRILFLGNNWVGWEVLNWLNEQAEEIVGLVIHPSHKRRYGDEIIRSAQVKPDHLFDASQIHQPGTLQAIRELRSDIGLSVLFDYVLQPEILNLFPAGVVNLHPAYLPYNRGQYPNVWSIVERTPAGATLHFVDSGVDTGEVIARRQVRVECIDTGETLYRKLELACVELFKETWPVIRSGGAPRIPQDRHQGTYHRTQDVEQIDHIDLDHTYKARDLIDVLRARTFPPYKGAYFVVNGKRVYVRLQLMHEEDL